MGNSSGNKGRFSERLKKIRLSKLKHPINEEELSEEEKTRNFKNKSLLKITLALPLMVYDNLIDKPQKITKIKVANSKKVTIDKYYQIDSQLQQINNQNITEQNKSNEINQHKYKVQQIREINNKKIYQKIKKNEIKLKGKAEQKEKSLEQQKIESLEKEIIDRIKKDLIHSINEYEILQSELYILSCIDSNDIELKKCQENIKEIKKLLSKVKSLKEKYNYLKDNVDFEYLLAIDDNFLVDKIIELKNICTYDNIYALSKDYKLLDEYKYLYLKIDKLHEKTNELEEKKKKKEEELKQRDIDYEKFKNKLYDINKINESFNNFVSEQNKILNELNTKAKEINQEEVIEYHFKGFRALLANSFKYVGLMMASPLKGLIPGIATQTIMTKNVIHNLSQTVGIAEERKTVYHAMDYTGVINNAINDLDFTNMEIDNTLSNIISLKEKYKDTFSKYSSDIPEYKDTLKKLNKIENSVMNTKIKLDIIKTSMKEKEYENKETMKKVRKLNNGA